MSTCSGVNRKYQKFLARKLGPRLLLKMKLFTNLVMVLISESIEASGAVNEGKSG